MSRLTNWLFLLSIGLTLLSSHTVSAEEDAEYDDEEFDDDEDAISSSDVTVKSIYPAHPDKKNFPLGKDVTLLVAFNNNGEKSFNISQIAAHLHSPFDYNYYIQNFTVQHPSATVGPNSQVTLEYTFKPDPTLETLEYTFSAYVNYNRSDGRTFMHTLHNATIDLYEPGSDSNTKLIMYAVVLAGLGVLAFVFTQSKAAKEEKGGVSESFGGNWEDDKIYKPSTTSKRAGGNKRIKKKV